MPVRGIRAGDRSHTRPHTHTRRGRGGGRETAFGFRRPVRIMRAPWQPGAPWRVCTRGAPVSLSLQGNRNVPNTEAWNAFRERSERPLLIRPSFV
eukprot:3917781-Prymnesium_polylepis.2